MTLSQPKIKPQPQLGTGEIFSPGTALVTGASKRIGQAIAFTLASYGYNIALHYHTSSTDALKTAELIREAGVRCELFGCDLAHEQETMALVKMVHSQFADLNILVNSASIFKKSRLDAKQVKSLDEHFTVNLKAPFILTAEFARLCKKGLIVNILDTHIRRYTTTHPTYLLSKKMLAELTRMSAVQLAPDIRVNGISPGLILPPSEETQAYLDERAKNIPLKKKGGVEFISMAVEYLLANDFVTGEILTVDGGEQLL